MKSAFLAREVSRALADPRRALTFDLSINNAIDTLRSLQARFPSNRELETRMIQRGERSLKNLNKSHKFVLQDDFALLIHRIASQKPSLLLDLMATARPPFDVTWI